MSIFGGPTTYYWTSMSILNSRNSLRGVGGRQVPARPRRRPNNSGHLAEAWSNVPRNQMFGSGNPSLRQGKERFHQMRSYFDCRCFILPTQNHRDLVHSLGEALPDNTLNKAKSLSWFWKRSVLRDTDGGARITIDCLQKHQMIHIVTL